MEPGYGSLEVCSCFLTFLLKYSPLIGHQVSCLAALLPALMFSLTAGQSPWSQGPCTESPETISGKDPSSLEAVLLNIP